MEAAHAPRPEGWSVKICTRCSESKPLDEFYRHVQRPDGLYNQCKPCVREQRRLSYRTDSSKKKVSSKRWRRTGKHGLAHGRFEEMLEAQGGACAVCLTELDDSPHIDHNHACCAGHRSCGACVRGLLCFFCNRRLAVLEDSAWREAAERYLAR